MDRMCFSLMQCVFLFNFQEIFELIVLSFDKLSCPPGRCYSKAVLILESVARLRSCVMMLDLDCDSLITKMFELFQKHIR